jgi:putative PIN family toxin of toxin-antitoxin system
MPDLRGVLDSNLLATALVSPNGPGNALVHAARIGRFELLVSSYLLREVRETLEEAFHVPPADATALVEFVTANATVLEPPWIRPISRDPDDDPILALAEQGEAAFLATYDHDLMGVGSVGACGVVHPLTALQVVTTATSAEVFAEGVPGVSTEDRTGWRYEQGGPALESAYAFVEWLRHLPANRESGRELVTPESWPAIQQAIADGTAASAVEAITGWLPLVRHPADGMAYVFCPRNIHPDQTEPFEVLLPTAMQVTFITLLLREGRWRVHALGPMIPPVAVGLAAYSW